MPSQITTPSRGSRSRRGHQAGRQHAADPEPGQEVAVALGSGPEHLVGQHHEQDRVDPEHQGGDDAERDQRRGRRRRAMAGSRPASAAADRPRRPRSHPPARCARAPCATSSADTRNVGRVEGEGHPRAGPPAGAAAPRPGPATTHTLSTVLRKALAEPKVSLVDQLRGQRRRRGLVDDAQGRGDRRREDAPAPAGAPRYISTAIATITRAEQQVERDQEPHPLEALRDHPGVGAEQQRRHEPARPSTPRPSPPTRSPRSSHTASATL